MNSEPLSSAVMEKLLLQVQKPGAYLGGEVNSIVKESVSIRMALSYPDLYEVGMANNGIRILYNAVNELDFAAAERVFAVAPDLEDLLLKENIPLYTLETLRPLHSMDAVAFNMAHELLYTSMLQVLHLGQIPLLRQERKENHPIVIAGGAAISNPLPGFNFFDVIFAGDGEEGIVDLVKVMEEKKGASREDLLVSLGEVPGAVVPSLYEVTGESVKGPVVQKRIYRGEGKEPRKPIVPSIRISQDRVVVEIARGCFNLCKFCHAGYYDLPYREQEYSLLSEKVLSMVDYTGYNEVTFSSLSVGDYRSLGRLLNELLPEFISRGISVSLPSLKVDKAAIPVIEAVSGVRKSSLTFAVESASDLIRSRAHKKVNLQDVRDIVLHVCEMGWTHVKFYFMLGLPGSREVDEAEEIITFLREIVALVGKRKSINVTLSPFVPKPHTPFEGEEMRDEDYFWDSVGRIRRGVPRSVSVKSHNVSSSILEGVISRGGVKISSVILEAFLQGARFDSWREYYNRQLWFDLLDEMIPQWPSMLDGRDGPHPWSMILTGYETLKGKMIEREADLTTVPEKLRNHGIQEHLLAEAEELLHRKYSMTGAMRIVFTKKDRSRFISHLDFADALLRGLRRLKLPMAYTQGFHKRERVSFGFPVPLGIASEAEPADILLYEECHVDLEELSSYLPLGVDAVGWFPIDSAHPVMSQTDVVTYRITFLQEGYLTEFKNSLEKDKEVRKVTKKKERRFPGSEAIFQYDIQGLALVATLYAGKPHSIRVDQLVEQYTSLSQWNLGADIVKLSQGKLHNGAEISLNEINCG